MAANNPNSPRQKMINLMYLVFIAMLALNVSSEVLDGFALVESTMLRSVKAASQRNDKIFSELADFQKKNPEKAQEWYDKGEELKLQTDSLFGYIQSLKQRIVIKADGKNGDPENLQRPDDLNAAYEVVFNKGDKEAKKLTADLDTYRKYVSSLVTNSSIKNIIENNLGTEPSKHAKENKQTWAESMFWQMPVAAAITLLTKLQNDILYAEGEVLTELVKNIDMKDYRVNQLEAFVIPESQIVMSGGTFKATIGVLAKDTTQKPRIFVNDKLLSSDANGVYTAGAGATGTFQLKGYVEMPRGDGSFFRQDFSTEYYVVQPSATIAPVLMNVLYAGISNEIQIAAPGIPSQNISAACTNGIVTHKGNDIWTVTPKLGSDAVVSVVAKMAGGRSQEMAKRTFRVRKLPDPTPYLNITTADGNKDRYKGGPLSKAALVSTDALSAAIDDGILDQPFTVIRFDLRKTNADGFDQTTPSDGARFSTAQKDVIRSMQRGQSLLIRNIVVQGPDGSQRNLIVPMDIRIN